MEDEEEVSAGAEEMSFLGGQSLDWVDSFFNANDIGIPYYKDGEFDIEACLEGAIDNGGDGVSDSAYGTLPTSEGQHGAYGVGLGMGMGMGMGGMAGLGIMGSGGQWRGGYE